MMVDMFVRQIAFCFISLMLGLGLVSCGLKADIPTEFPTPEPSPAATPLTMEYKPDAELEKQFAKIAEAAKGKVGVAAVVIETGEAAFLNADQHFPMQSVYKLPIAMAVMEQVRLDRLDLDEKVGVTKDDMVREGMRSPLRDQNPNGGEFTICELIRLSLVESDGTASDVLLRLVPPTEVQSYLTQIGIRDMKVVNTEKELGRDWQTQYENWSTPTAAIELIQSIQNWENDLGKELKELWLLKFMKDSIPGERRLKGLLPKNTVVGHKTGTGGMREITSEHIPDAGIVDFYPPKRIASATNDIGVIYLPNGNHLAIAVFVSDSSADEKTREAVIAKIAKAAWDRWSK